MCICVDACILLFEWLPLIIGVGDLDVVRFEHGANESLLIF